MGIFRGEKSIGLEAGGISTWTRRRYEAFERQEIDWQEAQIYEIETKGREHTTGFGASSINNR